MLTTIVVGQIDSEQRFEWIQLLQVMTILREMTDDGSIVIDSSYLPYFLW